MSDVRWQVPAEAAGERLDRHLAAHLEAPRNQVQRWIREGRVAVDGAPAKASMAVAPGQQVLCRVPEVAGDERVAPEAGPLAILYEDADLVALNKPAGLTVHPGAGRSTGTLVHRLLGRYPEMAGVGGPGRPGVVHRLDKDTSGVMVVARSPTAYQVLARDFAARRVDKRYLAVVYGRPEPATGEITTPIGRHPTRRKEMTVRRDGRPALTRFRCLAAASGVALLVIELATGRTHQIRVHLKSIGHPLVGDPIYGEARWKGCPRPVQKVLREVARPALHAWRLAFRHPSREERVVFEAPVPADLERLWQAVAGAPVTELLPRSQDPPTRAEASSAPTPES